MSQSVPLILNDDVESGHKEYDIEDDFAYRNNVQNASRDIRLAFIRKVYGLLSVQLFFTVVIASLFMYTPPIKEFVHQNDWMMILSFVLSIGTLLALYVHKRNSPTNLILLAAFTVTIAYSVGVTVTYFSQAVVIQALFLTLAVVAGLTIFTFQTKYDFSAWYSALFAGLWILIIASMIQMFFQPPGSEIIISIGGALLFSMFIIFDTQMIIRNLSAEEYILATITLYLDIINLFLYILRILQEMNR